ncbi:hypothetical protein BCR44DRAFT_1426914, partial [Catenaria anguillulae PL171]
MKFCNAKLYESFDAIWITPLIISSAAAMNIFRKESPKETIRKQQRTLRSAERDLDRDSVQLQRQEKQLELDIKKAAKAGQTAQAKALAKQLILVQKTMMEFDKVNSEMEMKEEIMNDAIDNIMDEEEDELEGEEILAAVLDEIGIEVSAALPSAGKSALGSKQAEQVDVDDEAEQMLKRLDALKSV